MEAASQDRTGWRKWSVASALQGAKAMAMAMSLHVVLYSAYRPT